MSINGEIIRLGNCFFSGKNLCKLKLGIANQVCLRENHIGLMEEKGVVLYRHLSKHLYSRSENRALSLSYFNVVYVIV